MSGRSNRRAWLAWRVRHAPRDLLRIAFRLEPWHSRTLQDKPYIQPVVDYLNSFDARSRSAAVDIGCGLGDVLRHTRFERRLGLDRDEQAVKAARALARLKFQRGITFRRYDFPDPIDGTFDAVVIVNWIHCLSPDELDVGLRRIAAANMGPDGVMVIDTVLDPEPGRFRHDPHRIAEELGRSARLIAEDQLGREVYALEPAR